MKQYFCDFERAISQKMCISCISLLSTFRRTLSENQFLKKFTKDLTQDQRNGCGPSAHHMLFAEQRWVSSSALPYHTISDNASINSYKTIVISLVLAIPCLFSVRVSTLIQISLVSIPMLVFVSEQYQHDWIDMLFLSSKFSI